MTNELLKQLQRAELEILSVIDSFCRNHHIIYSLYAGTAIGAVRHHGFIPWDDDIDICMTRNQLLRFCKEWEENPIDGYYLETVMSDPYCGTCHAKVRKNDTVLLSEGEIESEGHHGIWVDIFPLDKANLSDPKSTIKIARKLILLSRANVHMLNDGCQKKIIRSMIRALYPEKKRHSAILKCIKQLSINDSTLTSGYVWKSLSATYAFKYSFPPYLPDKTTTIDFEDIEFQIYSDYDEMLRIIYGDYMKLPPESERVCKHNPVKVRLSEVD